MTGLYFFQVEGLIRAHVRAREKGIVDVPSMVHMAWLRWLQLHGRQATVVVPMDGRLVSAFPTELLSEDTELLDRVARANTIGSSNRDEIGISVPSEFRTPSIAFAESVGMADFSVEIGRLIGLMFGAEFDGPVDGNRSHPNSSVSTLADRLFRDLAADIHGMQTGLGADYPGW